MAIHLKYLLITIFFVGTSCHTYAQFGKKLFTSETDTNYIADYSSYMTTRLFGSVKSASFRLLDSDVDRALDYLPNERMLFGLGANHGILGINIGINFPFINSDDEKYGTTDYLNLTTRILTRKIYMDLLFQYYKGYYLANSYEMLKGWPDADTFMLRPDLGVFSIGINGHYIFNNERFSYRAGFLQNEWQKKSAGSLLAGGEIYYHIIHGDSSMVPDGLKYGSFYEGQHFRRIDIFSIGPMIGYAHTFVLKQHWFLSLSFAASLALGSSKLLPDQEYAEQVKSGVTLNFNTSPRIAFGYNCALWCFDISYNNLSMKNQVPVERAWVQLDTGNFRFNIVRRFHMKKPIRLLNPSL